MNDSLPTEVTVLTDVNVFLFESRSLDQAHARTSENSHA